MIFLASVGIGLTLAQMHMGAEADAEAGLADIERQGQAIYNESYDSEIQKVNIRKAMHNANLNISSIQQDSILSNVNIKLRQDKAKANIEINAATAGVEGQTIDAAMYDAERNAAFDKSNKDQQVEGSMEHMVQQLGNYQTSVLEVQAADIDMSRQPTVYNTLARIDSTDIANVHTIAEGFWGGGSAAEVGP